MDVGGSPDNCRKTVNMTKIDNFGGPSKNCQKNVLGRLRIVKQMATHFPRTIILQLLDKDMVAASGRFQKRAVAFGLRPSLGQYFVKNMVLAICRESSGMVDFCNLDNVLTIFRRHSGIHQNKLLGSVA